MYQDLDGIYPDILIHAVYYEILHTNVVPMYVQTGLVAVELDRLPEEIIPLFPVVQVREEAITCGATLGIFFHSQHYGDHKDHFEFVLGNLKDTDKCKSL